MATKDTSKKAAKAAKPAKEKKPSRIKQIGESYRLTKKTDPRIGLILLGVFVVAGARRRRLAYLLVGSVATPPRSVCWSACWPR